MKIIHLAGITLLTLCCLSCSSRANISQSAEKDPESEPEPEPASLSVLRENATPLNSSADLGPLLERIGNAKLVLLGEASHGTSEFYRWRSKISKRLIEEKGFRFIAVEGDWVSIYQLNKYVKDLPGANDSVRQIMQSFNRWPTWMWANEETMKLVEWLHEYNKKRPAEERVGIYGMDVYGEDVARKKAIKVARQIDENLAKQLESAYQCLAAYKGDSGRYVRALRAGASSCEAGVLKAYQLIKEETKKHKATGEDPMTSLVLEHSSRVVKNAERHIRAMGQPNADSWNFRADHFLETNIQLMDFYGEDTRGIVWAHNTHIGDARATTMAQSGRRNIGQSARERLGKQAVAAVGFGTHRGTVKAAKRWGAAREKMTVPKGQADSYEDLMHRLGMDAALIIFNQKQDLSPLMEPRGHRAIGVVYNPDREHLGNYVPTVLPERYDAFIFLDKTQALKPILTES